MRANFGLCASKAKVLIASGGLVLSLTAGAGIASAQDLGPLINTRAHTHR